MAYSNCNVILYGISGNPPHRGHQANLFTGIAAYKADKAYAIINNESPDPKPNRASPHDRLDMAQAAFGDHPLVTVSDIEIRRGGISLAADTLKYFRSLYPRSGKNKLFYSIGEDLTLTITTWTRGQEVLDLIDVILVAPRTVDGHKNLELWRNRLPGMDVRALNVPAQYLDIASTDVRKLIEEGRLEEARELLPPEVFDIIIRRRLYQKIHSR